MARRSRKSKNPLKGDSKFNDFQLGKFINKVMLNGKKSLAENLVYNALSIVEDESKQPALDVFKRAVKNVMPEVEVKSRRVGGATYQVPSEIRVDRQVTLAMRWIIGSARGRSGKDMANCLAREFLDAFNEQGTAIKKKDDMHRMANANRAFVNYSW
jgi:small subunit ribosomal protein S7